MADDFFTRQLPHNVTWALTLLYALDMKGDLGSTSVQVCPSSPPVYQSSSECDSASVCFNGDTDWSHAMSLLRRQGLGRAFLALDTDIYTKNAPCSITQTNSAEDTHPVKGGSADGCLHDGGHILPTQCPAHQ